MPCSVSTATANPSGAKHASTAQTLNITRTCTAISGTMPARRMRTSELVRSTRQQAANAPVIRGNAWKSIAGEPATTRTTAAPNACHASGTADISRRAGTRPSVQSITVPISNPQATRPGAAAGGNTTSMGTSTTCVGSTCPAPTGNSTRATTAYSATSNAATSGWNGRAAPATASRPTVTATNSAPAAASTHSSRREARARSRASHVSSNSRSLADRASPLSVAALLIVCCSRTLPEPSAGPVGVDVEVVELPRGAGHVVGREDQAHAGGVIGGQADRLEHLGGDRRRPEARRRPRAVIGPVEGVDLLLAGDPVLTDEAHRDVQVRARRVSGLTREEPVARARGVEADRRRDGLTAGQDLQGVRVALAVQVVALVAAADR